MQRAGPRRPAADPLSIGEDKYFLSLSYSIGRFPMNTYSMAASRSSIHDFLKIFSQIKKNPPRPQQQQSSSSAQQLKHALLTFPPSQSIPP